jgi:hypothetical protein
VLAALTGSEDVVAVFDVPTVASAPAAFVPAGSASAAKRAVTGPKIIKPSNNNIIALFIGNLLVYTIASFPSLLTRGGAISKSRCPFVSVT